MSTNSTGMKCNICGEVLVLVKSKTARSGNHFSALTTTQYRCSNQTCQDEINRKVAHHLQMRKDQEEAKAERLRKTAETAAAAKL